MKALFTPRKREGIPSALYVLASGLLLGSSFLPLPLGWLAWVALVPLLILWERTTSFWWFFAEVYTTFLMAFAIGFFWPMLHVFEGVSWVAIGAQLLVPALWALPFIGSVPFRRSRGRLVGLAMLSAFFLALEMGLTQSPMAFPWPTLGYTQGSLPYIMQIAEVSGVATLTLWVLVVNGLSMHVYMTARRHRLLPVLAVIAALLMPAGFGLWRSNALDEAPQFITVGAVQPALETETWKARFGIDRLDRLTALSDSVIASMNAPPVLTIWPAMAVPTSGIPARQQRIESTIQTWTERHDTALLAGTLLPASSGTSPRYFHNSALLYQPQRTPQQYHQVIGTPMNHHAPVADHAPWLPAASHPQLVPGNRPGLLALDSFQLGVLLEYEVLRSDYMRQLIAEGADLLTVLAVDGYWGNTPGYRSHLHYARIRAIEARRSLLQVTASGGTALILPNGSVVFRSTDHEPSAHFAAVPLYESMTLYTRFGNWLGWLAVCLTALFGGTTLLRAIWRRLHNSILNRSLRLEARLS